MSFVEKYIQTIPDWALQCKPTTIYRLLALLEDRDTKHVSVRICGERAYVIIVRPMPMAKREHLLPGFSRWYLPRTLWLCVAHVLRTLPTQCPCWCCEWRRKRQIFCDIRNFDHVFFQSKVYQ